MAASHINDSKHWRDRAAERRALSDAMRDPETIGIMLRLADDYDTLADRALFAAMAGCRQLSRTWTYNEDGSRGRVVPQ
jgi:hypothetical protein